MRKFKITRAPYETDEMIFAKSSITVEPGVTVLVGCNGAGKTTMLRQIRSQLKKNKEPFAEFNNKTDGGTRAMDRYLWKDNMPALATMAFSSEGEQIMIVLGEQAEKIGQLAKVNRENDIFILFDAVDSGFSIDNICELKEFLFQTVINEHPKDVYILCTANSYEMARDEDCIDVMNCKHVRFNGYEDYREFILKSKEQKEKRSCN